jgi:hypothetical protein
MNWLKKRFRKSDADDEKQFDREIAFHLEELTEANIARGMAPDEARRRAVLDFGGGAQTKQQMRDVHSSADTASAYGRK